MKILWYNWRDIRNPEAGGAEVFTHEVCKRLVKKEYVESITLFTSSFPGAESEEVIDDIRVVRAGDKYSVYRKARNYYHQNQTSFDVVVDEINTKPFDTPSYVRDKPVIAVIHQLAREFWFYETAFPINLLGFYFLEKYWLRKYRNIPTITVSRSTEEDLRNWGFSDVSVVPEGISISPLRTLPEKEVMPTVLYVGRLKKAKKPDEALKAFRIIKDEMPDARLWIVGSGYMEQELREIARKLFPKDSSNITVFGKQSAERKHELMSRAHVLLVPGVREGWGLVVTEANAMGTPAVAYDVPGLRDSVIEGITGALVPSGDYVAMAIESVELLRNHVKHEMYSRRALRNASNFDWDKTTEEISVKLTCCLSQYSKGVGELFAT
ncbi:MAG: glycosyltransferase family 4 protein [Nitrososphaera sp.]